MHGSIMMHSIPNNRQNSTTSDVLLPDSVQEMRADDQNWFRYRAKAPGCPDACRAAHASRHRNSGSRVLHTCGACIYKRGLWATLSYVLLLVLAAPCLAKVSKGGSIPPTASDSRSISPVLSRVVGGFDAELSSSSKLLQSSSTICPDCAPSSGGYMEMEGVSTFHPDTASASGNIKGRLHSRSMLQSAALNPSDSASSGVHTEGNAKIELHSRRSMLQSAAVNPGIAGIGTPLVDTPALVDTPEEFMAAAQRGDEEILVMNHMDFTQLPYSETASVVLHGGTQIVRGDCHREAPADFCTPKTRPHTLPLLPRLTGQCILLVSGSFLRVHAFDKRMWLQGLYIHVASPMNTTTVLNANTTGATESNTNSTRRKLRTVFDTSNTNNTFTSASEQQIECSDRLVGGNSTGGDLECVPKLLEIESGLVWATDLTMRGNEGSVSGVTVRQGGSLYMKGGQLANLGNATSVAHMHDTAAFQECNFMNNTLLHNSSIIYAQGEGAVKLKATNFTANVGGSTLRAETPNNVFYSDDPSATVNVQNFNSSGDARRLSATPVEVGAEGPALTGEAPSSPPSFLSGDDEWFVAHQQVPCTVPYSGPVQGFQSFVSTLNELQVGVPPASQASGTGDRLSPLMIGLCVLGLVVTMGAICVAATLFRRLTADRTETSGSPRFWATNMMGDSSLHGGNPADEGDPGISISGKSLNPLMHGYSVRSNFMAPLPEAFIEEEPSDSIHGMHAMHAPHARIPAHEQAPPFPDEDSVQCSDDELADCFSEESSFCLPDPLQLQATSMAQYHMQELHQMEDEVAEHLEDDPDVHGTPSGFRGVTDAASIGVYIDPAVATQQDPQGYVTQQQSRSDMHAQQWVGARRTCQPPGGGRRGGQRGRPRRPSLPNIPEESCGKSSASEEESGSIKC